MKQGQETNQIWTQEAGTHDTHNRTLTLKHEDYEDILMLVCLSDRWRLAIFEILLLLS